MGLKPPRREAQKRWKKKGWTTVKRIILAAALAVATLGANADYFFWFFQDNNKFLSKEDDYSLYVFVSGVKSGNILDGTGASNSGYLDKLQNTTYMVQSEAQVLDTVSKITAGNATTADLGTLTLFPAGPPGSTGDIWFSAIGAASFTAFAVVFDSATITSDTKYMLLRDCEVKTQVEQTIVSDYMKSGDAFESLADNRKRAVYWGVRAEGDYSGKWESVLSIPEPTSGVMLLLGVAALSLKRKRAA